MVDGWVADIIVKVFRIQVRIQCIHITLLKQLLKVITNVVKPFLVEHTRKLYIASNAGNLVISI